VNVSKKCKNVEKTVHIRAKLNLEISGALPKRACDVEGTFYYFHGALRTSFENPNEVWLTYSNPIKITTIPPRDEEPETQPEEETPEQKQPEEEPYVFPFADVAESAWYYSDVFSANKLGLIDGKNSSLFCPDDSMTVAEAIKLAACLNQLYSDGEVTLENGTAAWYDTYVAYALLRPQMCDLYRFPGQTVAVI